MIRKSHDSAISKPPPSAKPLIAAMVGKGSSSNPSKKVAIRQRYLSRISSGVVPIGEAGSSKYLR
jgi:hypothetical protein